MKNNLRLFWIVILFCTTVPTLFSQNSTYYLPINFRQSYEPDIRSADGKPGKNYWQNRADYKIEVNFDPKKHLVAGQETIIYHNNSPDNLSVLVVHLFPNVYKKGSARDFDIGPVDASDGVVIKKQMVNGQVLRIG